MLKKIFIVLSGLILTIVLYVFAPIPEIDYYSGEDSTTVVNSFHDSSTQTTISDSTESENQSATDDRLAEAYRNHHTNLPVEGEGEVIRILRDDDVGSRHQRFILKISSGQTILVAHNIDLAPRIGNLEIGDHVSFKGIYVWNSQGGIIHWTHHDPAGKHTAGWLEVDGRRYE